MFVQRAWCVVALTSEIGDRSLGRTIAGRVPGWQRTPSRANVRRFPLQELEPWTPRLRDGSADESLLPHLPWPGAAGSAVAGDFALEGAEVGRTAGADAGGS